MLHTEAVLPYESSIGSHSFPVVMPFSATEPPGRSDNTYPPYGPAAYWGFPRVQNCNGDVLNALGDEVYASINH
jgi:hypothetical protein